MRDNKKTYLWRVFLATVLAWIGAAGCSRMAVIQNVTNAPNVFVGGQAHTLADVGNSIVVAGARLDWNMAIVKPGMISGVLDVRGKHHVEIQIDYDTKTYSITYVRSTGLKAEQGMIHRNYNRWIANLERGIRSEQVRMLSPSAR